jgi:hypothetical protein
VQLRGKQVARLADYLAVLGVTEIGEWLARWIPNQTMKRDECAYHIIPGRRLRGQRLEARGCAYKADE